MQLARRLGASLGAENVTVGNAVQARAQGNNYIDVGFLIDNSASMGIGATDGDQQTMVGASGCAFACRRPRDSVEATRTPQSARKAHATLKSIWNRQAIVQAIAELKAKRLGTDQLRSECYTFSNDLVQLFSADE